MKNIISDIRILNQDEAREARKTFIDTFIKKDSDYYKKYIKELKKFSDGQAYIGYLWDCFSIKKVINMDIALSIIEKKFKILILWDIHSKDMIKIKDYWKFDKEDVIELHCKNFPELFLLFPEDFYVFDVRYDWAIAFTHEYDDSNTRFIYYHEF